MTEQKTDESMSEINEMLKNAEDMRFVSKWTNQKEVKLIDGIINDKILLKQLISLGLSLIPANDKALFENYARVATAELSEISSIISFYEEQKADLMGGDK